eukprot:TRINITY_DN10689_c0_g2_i2.p1 TRINITY_DN10689_c0_g2~~TRINITY_DN10689_c0_g2_i2.p1  ORF type:complete len:118 (+),score=12.92 TRINITY_DN10689_c0_g2_i2:168-521(+)
MIAGSMRYCAKFLFRPISTKKSAKPESAMLFREGPYVLGEPVIGATYLYCTCGNSRSHPFCDHTHMGTSYAPMKFSFSEYKHSVLVCACKNTETPPLCDGTCAKSWKGLKLSDNEPV